MADILVKVQGSLLARAHVRDHQEAERLVSELLETYVEQLSEESTDPARSLRDSLGAAPARVESTRAAWAALIERAGATERRAIGAEAFQRTMAHEALERNELSRGIQEMREE